MPARAILILMPPEGIQAISEHLISIDKGIQALYQSNLELKKN